MTHAVYALTGDAGILAGAGVLAAALLPVVFSVVSVVSVIFVIVLVIIHVVVGPIFVRLDGVGLDELEMIGMNLLEHKLTIIDLISTGVLAVALITPEVIRVLVGTILTLLPFPIGLKYLGVTNHI